MVVEKTVTSAEKTSMFPQFWIKIRKWYLLRVPEEMCLLRIHFLKIVEWINDFVTTVSMPNKGGRGQKCQNVMDVINEQPQNIKV